MNLVNPKLLSLIIILSIIFSGSSFWLKRTGFVNHDKYEQLLQQQEFFKTKLNQFLEAPSSFSPEQLEKYKKDFTLYKNQVNSHVYAADPNLYILKYSKLFASLAIVILGIISLAKRGIVVTDKFVLSLVILILLSTVVSLMKFGWPPIISSVYFYLFLLMMMLSQSFVNSEILKTLSRFTFYSFIFFLVTAILELILGLSIFSSGSVLQKRVVSLFNQPNTLGIFSVCALSLYVALSSNNLKSLISYTCFASAFILIILSGSNTAAILLPFCFLNLIFNRSDEKQPLNNFKLKLLLLFCGFVTILILSERFAINSMLGRIYKYQYYFSEQATIFNIIFGHGIGIGTNSILSVGNYFNFAQPQIFPINFSVDSTPLSLIIQIGLIGCLLFYWLLFRAMIDDKELRPTYIVILISSLTINIIELFPVNVILALMLAKSQKDKMSANLRFNRHQ